MKAASISACATEVPVYREARSHAPCPNGVLRGEGQGGARRVRRSNRLAMSGELLARGAAAPEGVVLGFYRAAHMVRKPTMFCSYASRRKACVASSSPPATLNGTFMRDRSPSFATGVPKKPPLPSMAP